MTSLIPSQRALTVSSIDDKIDLIKSTVAKDATDTELELFLHQCRRMGLDPLAKQIYFQKRWNKKQGRHDMTILVGIDGYRLVADRTGQYAGSDDPVFDNEESPRKATVTVYKLIGGVRCPFTATARWDQYYPGDSQGFMWNKMPHLMLGKCAEALALRKAFPAELSGAYIKEEMDQAGPAEVPSFDGAAENVPFQGPPAKLVGSSPDLDLYVGSDAQREVLRAAFAQLGLDNRDKHAIAEAMKNKPMASLDRVVSDYLKTKH